MTRLDTLPLQSFIPAGLALNLTPGADRIFCLGQNLRVAGAQVLLAGLGAWVVARPLVIFWQAFRGTILHPKGTPAVLPQCVDLSRPMLPRFLPFGLAFSLGNGVGTGIFAGLAIRPALIQRG